MHSFALHKQGQELPSRPPQILRWYWFASAEENTSFSHEAAIVPLYALGCTIFEKFA